MPIAADREINSEKDARHIERVCSRERSLQDRLGNLKTDKIVVGLRSVISLGDLVHIEAKLYLHVRGGLFLISDDRSILPCQFGIHHRNCTIGRDWMAGGVSGIMC